MNKTKTTPKKPFHCTPKTNKHGIGPKHQFSFSMKPKTSKNNPNRTTRNTFRFSKSVSLLNRLNQRAMNAMRLHIPTLKYHNPPPAILDNESDGSSTTPSGGVGSGRLGVVPCKGIAVINIDENDELAFQTPNCSGREDYAMDDFRTPLNEMPSPPPLSANSVYSMNYLNTPSPTYRSVNSNSQYGSRDSDLNQRGSGDSESETADDSGLDENFHTPRVAKIKSMENLSILEMEFHKASQELDRNSPRRLKLLADKERQQMPKMKSLNNLCFDDYSEEQVRAEFQQIREQRLEEKYRFNFQHRKSSTSSTNSGKLFVKHTKVGNAKFIGNEYDSPQPQQQSQGAGTGAGGAIVHFPIQKMRSMGTIPDVVTERIEPDPFLTPTSGRRPNFPMETQSAEKAAAPSYAVARLLNYDCVDGAHTPQNHLSHSSLNELYSHDRMGKFMGAASDTSFMSRTPFERAYRRTLLKSSTPFRQSFGLASSSGTNSEMMAGTTEDYTAAVRHSNHNAGVYELMRNPSSGSLVISETGSLDRMKNTVKGKKGPLDDGPRVSDRVEETRVNPNSLIDEILKDTKLDQLEAAETSGLQLYIAKDGTTTFGNHEVKSRVLAGAFKQVVMENPR